MTDTKNSQGCKKLNWISSYASPSSPPQNGRASALGPGTLGVVVLGHRTNRWPGGAGSLGPNRRRPNLFSEPRLAGSPSRPPRGALALSLSGCSGPGLVVWVTVASRGSFVSNPLQARPWQNLSPPPPASPTRSPSDAAPSRIPAPRWACTTRTRSPAQARRGHPGAACLPACLGPGCSGLSPPPLQLRPLAVDPRGREECPRTWGGLKPRPDLCLQVVSKSP